MTYKTDYAGYPNYFPNSFSGPANAPDAMESKFAVSGDVARYNEDDGDDFTQVRTFWTKVLDEEARGRLVRNIVASLKNAQTFIQVKKKNFLQFDWSLIVIWILIQERAVKIFNQVDAEYGRRVREGLDKSFSRASLWLYQLFISL